MEEEEEDRASEFYCVGQGRAKQNKRYVMSHVTLISPRRDASNTSTC